MLQYFVRRILLIFPVLLGVSILVFVLARVLPGDIIAAQSSGGSFLGTKVLKERRHELGLDRPLVVQYGDWIAKAARLDFGDSLWNRRSVGREIARALPVTLELTLLATLLAVAVAVPLGVLSAMWRGTGVDFLARLGSALGLSVPDFVLGSLAITYFALWFSWTPPAGYISPLVSPWRNLQQFLLPAAVLGSQLSASLLRLTRSAVLNVLGEDYVRTARAKGLRMRTLLRRHVLRNALLPVVTLLGTQLGYLLAGAVIVESIFSLAGLGALTIGAINNRDYLILQAVTLLAAVTFTVLNLVVDLSYAWLDPRIRLA